MKTVTSLCYKNKQVHNIISAVLYFIVLLLPIFRLILIESHLFLKSFDFHYAHWIRVWISYMSHHMYTQNEITREFVGTVMSE